MYTFSVDLALFPPSIMAPMSDLILSIEDANTHDLHIKLSCERPSKSRTVMRS
jgi:hypothetical protein